MECDYTHLNHNSLMSHKKMVNKGVIINGVLLHMTCKSHLNENHLHLHV
jgi:hypothetical protein